jgi:hypothetical protein
VKKSIYFMGLACLLASRSVDLDAAESLPEYPRWFWIGTSVEGHLFADRRSLSGSENERSVWTYMIYVESNPKDIQSLRVLYRMDCRNRTSRKDDVAAYSSEGRLLERPVIKPVDRAPKPVIPESNGELMLSFACKLDSDGLPFAGLPIMLNPQSTANLINELKTFKLDPNGAAAIAGIDVAKAPKAFQELLNAYVPARLWPIIKTLKSRQPQ